MHKSTANSRALLTDIDLLERALYATPQDSVVPLAEFALDDMLWFSNSSQIGLTCRKAKA